MAMAEITPQMERALRRLMEKEQREEDELPDDVRAAVKRRALAEAVGLQQLSEREQVLIDLAVERAQRELVEKLLNLGLM